MFKYSCLTYSYRLLHSTDVRLRHRRTVEIAIDIAQHCIEVLQPIVQCLFTSPHMQLVHELRHNQERSPATNLLRLENVAEDMIANVQNVFAFGSDKRRENVARTWKMRVITMTYCCNIKGALSNEVCHPFGLASLHQFRL